MNINRIIERCWPTIGLTTAALLLLTSVFATGAMAQEQDKYSIIRLSGLGYFEPIEVEMLSQTSEVVHALPDSEVNELSPINEVAESRLTLDLKLRAFNPTACVGSSLWLEVEITNTGKKPVMIGKHEVWASFSYHRFHTDLEEERDGTTYLGGISLDYFTLEVGQSFRDTFEFSLSGHGFFGNVGRYALRSKIESVKSNEVIFELSDCGNTKEEAN